MAGWTDYVTDGNFEHEPIVATWPAICNAAKERAYMSVLYDQYPDYTNLNLLNPDIRPTLTQINLVDSIAWNSGALYSSGAGGEGFVFFEPGSVTPKSFLDPNNTGTPSTAYLESLVGPREDWKYCTAKWANQVYQLLNLYVNYRSYQNYWDRTSFGGAVVLGGDNWGSTVAEYKTYPATEFYGVHFTAYHSYREIYLAVQSDTDNYRIWGPDQNTVISPKYVTALPEYDYLTANAQMIVIAEKYYSDATFQSVKGLVEDEYSLLSSMNTNINGTFNLPTISYNDTLTCSFDIPTRDWAKACVIDSVWSNYIYLNNIQFEFHS